MIISNQAEWHKERRLIGFRTCPNIRKLYKNDTKLLPQILFNPILQTGLAYLCTYFSYPIIIIMAWTIGSFLVFMKKNLLHEMSHNLIFGKLNPLYKSLITSVM